MAANGEAISRRDGKLVVPDRPIIPFIEGDGTGPDIWRASVRVFDAAVEKRLRRAPADRLARSPRRRESVQPDGELATRRDARGVPRIPRGHQGTVDDAGRRRHSIAQRRAAAGTRSLRLSAARPVLQGHGDAGQAAGPGGHGDLSREHRGHLRRHRVSGGNSGGRRASRSSSPRRSRSSTRRFAFRTPPASASSRSRARAASG